MKPAPVSSGISDLLPVEAIFGRWTLTDGASATGAASTKSRCDIALSNLGAGEVRGVLLERCSIGAVRESRGWRATPTGFELLDASGRSVQGFRRVDSDHFESLDGRYRLDRSPIA